MDEHDAMRAQQQEAMDADVALQEMKQATQRLDEILQHMCAASSSCLDAAGIDSEDALFADAQEHTSDHDASTSVPVIDSEEGAQQQRRRAVYASVQEYFIAIETALASADDLSTAIHVSDQQLRAVDGEPIDREGQGKQFAGATRHMAYCFTSATDPSDWASASNTRERVVAAVPSSAELETNLPYDHFVARLRAQMRAQDQLLPAAKIDAIVREVVRVVLAQNATTVNAIRSHFYESEIQANQAQEVRWQQANNQATQICICEAQCDFQWGLQVVVTIASLVRAQTKTHHQQVDDVLDGPMISTTLRHSLFLPKSSYNAPHTSLSSNTSVYLMHRQTQPSSYSETKTSTSTEPQAYEPSTSSKSSSSASQDDSAFATGYFHEFPTHELPELLKIYVRGGFSDNALSANSTTSSHQHQEFVRLNIQTPFPRMRIIQAACSRFHTLLLSDLGMVFAFGLSVDGALGLGFEGMRRAIKAPRLLTYFFDKLITIRTIACGGDPMAGAHSAAVTLDGSVYTWGTGVALGNRSAVSHSEPQLIQLPGIDETGEEAQSKAMVIHSITCGGGFCIALSETGHAFAWGKWSDGRLGLGKIPILNQSSRKYGRRRQFQSFQLSPRPLTSDTNHRGAWRFAKVSCGEAHCIALTRNGELLTWGRGTHGQLGLGSTRDALAPTKVVISSERHLKWRDVAAGENWSMALDEHGRVWTWGACGGAVLGMGTGSSEVRKTAIVTEMILQRHFRLLRQQQSSAVTAPPLPQLSWMRPQLVPCFGNGGIKIHKLSAGLQHAAAISNDGDLYLWGDGHGFSTLPSFMRSPGSNEPDMGSEIVEHVACGGDLVVVFTSGSFLARSMQTLHRQCAMLSAEHQDLDRSALYQVTTHLATDIVLLVSGKRLFAHKLLLARRSAVLRDLILNEQRDRSSPPLAQKQRGDGDDTTAVIMELLLPQLRVDVAQVLLEFIYTDNFSLMLDPQSYLIRDVLRAAQLYQLPSLARLCREALAEASSLSGTSAAMFPLEGLDSEFAHQQGDEEEARSLNTDLQFAFGDRTWSDLTLVAEGNREIPVHRCVLVARSEYFRALLGFQLKQNSPGNETMVQVDESYAAMLRVLNFIYNDHVALPTTSYDDDNHTPHEDDNDDGAKEQLLEDLIAADKYGLMRWKRLCEQGVVVDLANCLEVLAVADLVSAAHLKQVALAFLQSNLHVVTAEPAFARFKDDFPHLLEELFTNIRTETINEALVRNWHEAVETQINAQRAQEEREWKAKSERALAFPWLYLILTLTFATLYLAVMAKQMHEYPFVPALNLLALLGFIGALFFGWI